MRMLAILALLGVSAPVAAQEVGPDSAASEVQAYAPGMPFMALPVSTKLTSANASAIVLPLRSEPQLREAMQVAESDLRRADARLVRANESKSHVRSQAQQRRLELREIEKKKKETKSKADEKLLDAQQRAAQRELDWAGQLEAMGDAELDAAREARLVAQAKQQALDFELQLTQKRAARTSTGGEGLDVVIRELERQTLDAQKQYWKRAHELALTEEDLAEKRLDLYRSAVEKK